ncbi:MAG: sodium/solute symporter [Firmicutes bacterium]|jgi:sodium/pantothenate symporter|nr:sodium/solute symporter [Bacillota bacterium]
MLTWGIMIVYFIGVLVLGLVAERYSRGVKEFFVAGRRLGFFVLAMTWFATAYSGSTFIGFGGFIWKWGWATIVYLAAETCAPLLQYGLYARKIRHIGERIDAVTLPDLLAHRYDSDTVRLLVAVITLLFSIPMMVVQYTAAGRLFEGFLGVDYVVAVVVFAGIVTVYTALGGFLAVAWTDTLQGLIMLAGVLVLTAKSLSLIGGLSGINAAIAKIDPAMMSLPGPGNYMPPAMVFSTFLIWTFGWVGQPALTTRFLAMRDTRTCKMALVVSALAVFLTMGLLTIPGLAARVLFPTLASPDLAFPSLLKKLMSPLMSALFAAAVLAAAMSTCDSILLVAAGAATRDIYQKVLNRSVSDEQVAKMSRVVILMIGIVTILASLKPLTLITMIMIFVTSGFGIFTIPLTFGLFWKRGTTAGAIASLIAGEAFLLFQYFVLKFNPLGLHPYVWALGIGIAVYVTVSLVTKPVQEEVLLVYFDK